MSGEPPGILSGQHILAVLPIRKLVWTDTRATDLLATDHCFVHRHSVPCRGRATEALITPLPPPSHPAQLASLITRAHTRRLSFPENCYQNSSVQDLGSCRGQMGSRSLSVTSALGSVMPGTVSLFCSSLYPLLLTRCSAHNRCTIIFVGWMNESISQSFVISMASDFFPWKAIAR